jgi:hypothetical protein
MTLNEFRDAIQKYGFKVWRNDKQITVDYNDHVYANIDLSKEAFARVDTEKLESVDLDKRKALLSVVAEFAITPADRRHEKVIARHNANMYVREVECWNNGMNIIFTCDKEKADQYITYGEREILDKLFGKAVSYEEIYSGK